jgi:NADPH-dependent curcumin reductase CurA
MTVNRCVVLKSRPAGEPRPSDFELVGQPMPAPCADALLVRVLECSLDPAMRRWMDAESYGTPIPLGGTLPCTLVGQVVHSECDTFTAGDFVTGRGTLSDYAVLQADGFTRRVDTRTFASPSIHLSVLGTSGLTAYNGLLKVGKPKPGETVLVSAAAGSVGSLVGQIAKLHGCRTVGITGGAAKCSRLLDEYGFDAAIDRLDKDLDSLTRAVHASCPDGVDVYFDNVGGACLEAAIAEINHDARIVLCGMISQYNSSQPASGPRNLWQLVAKTATMTGFLNRKYLADCANELHDLRRWVEAGEIVWHEHVEEGLENFYRAFMRLFDGSNDGKLILRVAKAA